MKHDDIRGACLGLVKSRLHRATARPTRAAALGWQLAQSQIALSDLAALCATWIADDKSPPCWRPSRLLRTLFAEYRHVRDAHAIHPLERDTMTALHRRSPAEDRRTTDYSTH